MAELEPHYAAVSTETLPSLPRNPIHVVVDNIRSAFNVGSIFRTCDACAAAHIHLCGMAAHPPHKKLEKTALGAFEYVPWTYYERTKDCFAALRKQNIPIAAIEVAEGASGLHGFDWPKPVAVVLGNEVNGIHARNLARCDYIVRIPMHGYKNSINVATAAGIVLYDILAKWGSHGGSACL